MSFLLGAYYENIDTGPSYSSINPVSDPFLTIGGDEFQSNVDLEIFALYAQGPSLSAAKLVSERRPALQYMLTAIHPFTVGANPPTDPNLLDLRDRPYLFAAADGLEFQVINDGAGAEKVFGLVWLTAGLQPAPAGEVFILRGTGSTASTAGVWSEVSLTWDDPLIPGRYGIVGSECVSGNAVAHRWILSAQVYRPGALSQTALTGRTHSMFYRGELGLWGTFDSALLPRLEVLTSAADSSHTVYLHLVRMDEDERGGGLALPPAGGGKAGTGAHRFAVPNDPVARAVRGIPKR